MDLNDRISRSSLHIEVADRVRDMIFDRSLPPGYRIDELDLSAKLGTSRTPLREALKVLANEGLVRLGSVGTSVWGGLRLGRIRAAAQTIQALATRRASLDLGTPLLEQ